MEFETERLTVRAIGLEDADFMLASLNDPGFLANIGDREVRTIADAEAYIRARVLASYAANGFGMLRVALKASDEAVGTVGLVRREGLPAPDLGFAFLAGHVGRGYGYEAASGLLAAVPAMRPLLAITAIGNHASAGLLVKLGFLEKGLIRVAGHDEDSRLFRLGPIDLPGDALEGREHPAVRLRGQEPG